MAAGQIKRVRKVGRKIVVSRIHRRATPIQAAASRVEASLKVEPAPVNKLRSLVLLGYDNDIAPLWQQAWLATGLHSPSSPAHKGDILYAAALQGQTRVESILAPHHTGFIMQIHGGYEQVHAYLQAQARRFRVLLIERDPRNEAERDSLRACRRYWQPLADATLHASQIADDHRLFWDALETLGYPLKRRPVFIWPPSVVPPAPQA